MTRSRVLTVATDVTDPQQTEAMADAAVERFGTPYGLVNAAGITLVGSLLDVDMDKLRRVSRRQRRGHAERESCRRAQAGRRGAPPARS